MGTARSAAAHPLRRPTAAPAPALSPSHPRGAAAEVLLLQRQDTKRLTHRPSSLIYEVADWTRKHNRDSPSHLQGETPESSNFVRTKASRETAGLSGAGQPSLQSPARRRWQVPRVFLLRAGAEAALSPGLCRPSSPGTSAAHPLPRELKCSPAPVTAKRFLSASANLSRFSYRCEPINSMERKKGTPHHSNYLSWPELQVTFPSSTEVAVRAPWWAGFFFFSMSLFF